jgi:hypothetical protein
MTKGKTFPKKYKNPLFEQIQEKGLNPIDFIGRDFPEDETNQHKSSYLIQYKNSYLRFLITYFPMTYLPTSIGDFSFKCSYFSRSGIEELPSKFPYIQRAFSTWLDDVKKYQEEEEDAPDLWEQMDTYKDFIISPSPLEIDFHPFSEVEKVQVLVGISEFQRLIAENYNLTEEQQSEINKRLDYIKAAVDRLNRFDWKALTYSTIIGITITLTLDTESGRALFRLFQQAFQHIVYLLHSPH